VALRSFLSTAPNRNIIVFVHGYGGDPVSTWADFDRLSRIQLQLRGYDFLFYDYDGLRSELRASVSLFYDFLVWLFASPVVAINNCLPRESERPASFGYDNVILVCHSLGAVVARLALLRATQEGKTWVSNVRLVLFAPAHKGARVVELALEVSTNFSFLRLFARGVRFESPLIDQLRQESKELTELETGTRNALVNGKNQHLVARKVCIAELEHIVFNDRFCEDPEGEGIRHSTHKTICKPRKRFLGKAFLKPLEKLIECLP
jgi:pimeloyl-ACP methyl ester carboxylesterase